MFYPINAGEADTDARYRVVADYLFIENSIGIGRDRYNV